MSTNTTSFELKDLRLFEGCSRRQRRAVEQIMAPATLPAGRVLMRQGEPGRECMIICSGSVSIERNGVAVGEAGPGDVVGEAALLIPVSGRSATAVTVTECEVLVLDRDEFRQLQDAAPAAWVRINKLAVRHLARSLDLEAA